MKAKRCPICNTIYPAFKRQCPNCFYKEPFDVNILLSIVLIIAIIPLTYFHQVFINGNKSLDSLQLNTKNIEEENSIQAKKIYLKPMSDLSGLSKEEILNIRKNALNKSLVFSNIKNYEPSPEVYKIEDNLPWISAYEIIKNGTKNNPNIGLGPSRHSIMIKNPEILLGYIIPDYGIKKENYEPDETDYFFPKKATWDEKNNTINVYFDYQKFMNRHNYSNMTIYTDDTNARDLGYNWVYCSEKSGAVFKSTNNISKIPYEIKGFYHKGYACGLKDGCNNYSPRQDEMLFEIVSKSATLKFKFWKNRPLTPFQKADINYIMHFE